jgi:LmbE family N-acetylglucosaminyl deacetylase
MGERKSSGEIFDFNSCAVITAHPDDETLWAGGTILMHPEVRWTIVTICRKSDPDRSAKFSKALDYLRASGQMGDLDDSPRQTPLAEREIEDTIASLLSADRFDLIITHSLYGEYTRHRRHEETARAVWRLWKSGTPAARQMWMFAYEDGGGKKLPQPIPEADLIVELPEDIWKRKYHIITKIYGFGLDSFEAKTTPRQEAFWRFTAADDVERRLRDRR